MSHLEDKKTRHVRNFLLDARLQLKMTSYVVGAAAVMAVALGALLWRSSKDLLEEANVAVEARSQAAIKSKELGEASLNSDLLQHFDDPSFNSKLKELSAEIDRSYETERQAVLAQHERLLAQHRILTLAIAGGLLLFLFAAGAGTVIASHRIAGPIYRLKTLMQEVAAGSLLIRARLRRKDELQDLFHEFETMLEALRSREEETAARLAKIAQEPGLPASAREQLLAMESIFRARLSAPLPEAAAAPEARTATGGKS